MKIVTLILSLLLLTSCSNPDTSGGVALSRGGGGDWDNTFPNGSCKGPDYFDNQGSKTGCGWVHSDEGSHYITSCSNPETWDGVTLSRGCGNDSTNVYPYGSCEGPSADAPSSGKTGCGWISVDGKTHYIMPCTEKTGCRWLTTSSASIDPAVITTSSGLQYVDLVVGLGVPVAAGQTVSVHYVGSRQNGDVFDTSLTRGTPFEFTLGQGHVIQGFDEGVVGMRVGGRRRLNIPVDMAYGPNPPGGAPGGPLVFDVQLLKFW